MDQGGAARSRTCYVLLVLDHDSSLPVGVWTSKHEPGPSEMGLALYQAIWHVGRLDWPLRGGPGLVKVPASLIAQVDNLPDVRRAAECLLVGVDTYKDERRWRGEPIVQQLQGAAADAVYAYTSRPYASCQEVQDAVLAWLHQAVFASHNPAEIPKSFWSTGYAMPGYDSPAAGWLLPRANDSIRSVRNGVMRGDMLYTNSGFSIEPGHTLSYRMFPYVYSGTQRGLFLEYEGELHYLEPMTGHRLP